MPDSLVAVVEIPKGSSNKYEWDDELGAIKLDPRLFSSLGYPTDYGFFRDTIASDGDPLDAMIAVSEPSARGGGGARSRAEARGQRQLRASEGRVRVDR